MRKLSSGSSLRLCRMWALALAFTAAPSLAAYGTGPRYTFQHYGTETGLENSTVLSLLQDKAGYLWVGTESGLFRYEGSRFRFVGAAAGLGCLAEIRGLAESEDGSVWAIACNQLYRSSRGQFELATHKQIIMNSLQGITSDGEGGVLVGTQDGLLHASGGRDISGKLAVEMLPLPEPLLGKPVRGVYRDRKTLWLASGRELWSFASDKLTRYGIKDGLADSDWDAIRVTAAGDLWVRSTNLTFWRPHGQARFQPIPGLPPSFSSGYLGLSGDGSVLIPTTNGLAIVDSRGVLRVGDTQGLRTSLTNVAIEDRQGSIWIGLLGEGLARWLGRNEWEGWSIENGLPNKLIWNIIRARSDRALWIGTAQGVVRLPVSGAPRVWNWAQQLNGNVRWLREAPDGAIWLIAQGETLARIEPSSGRLNFFGKMQGMTAGRILRGSFDRQGRLWIATGNGLFVARKPTIAAHFALVPGSPSGLWDVAEDKQGSLFATTANGLWRYADGHWRRYGKSDGLLTDSEYVIAIAPDGALWFRHRYDGTVERVAFDGDRVASVSEIKPDGVPTELTALHGFDSLGHYWQGTSHGLSMLADPVTYVSEIARMSAGNIKGFATNAWRYYSAEDGLISNDCDGEAFWADDDGSVWIGTSSGLAHYSPRQDQFQSKEKPEPDSMGAPVITSVQVSQRPRSARIGFSSLSFKTEGQARFAYSIDGGNWIDAKEREVVLASLRPGEHQFRVRTHAWGHPWSRQTAEAQFQFNPFWWETWWATAGLYFSMAGTLLGGLYLRASIHRRSAEERARILADKAQAEASSHAKSLFLTHMSHEIRTPLHQIMGLTEDLATLKLPQDAREIVNLLRSSGSGLFDLLNGILDFSKIEAGKLQIEKSPFNLHDCINESMTLFSRAAAEKGIKLAVEQDSAVPLYVLGDAFRTRQVLVCLISNAVKFTHKGEVRLIASAVADDARRSTIRFSVVDSGIGIAQETLGKLFTPFTQGDASTSRTYGGAGLGLTIARSLILLMGGNDLSVESQPGQGTSCQFSISFERVAAENMSSAPPIPLASNLRILVAEDSKINQKILLNLLARIGYQADLANDGREALAAVTRQTYDLILMDIQMPNMDGLDATRAIRDYCSGGSQPRIFAVTAHSTTDDRQACLKAGMDGYLTKPVNREILSRTLADVEETLTADACPAPIAEPA